MNLHLIHNRICKRISFVALFLNIKLALTYLFVHCVSIIRSMTTISPIHDTVAQGIVKQGNSISYSSGNNVHRPELIAATNILTRKFSIKIYLPDDNEVNINETTAFEVGNFIKFCK